MAVSLLKGALALYLVLVMSLLPTSQAGKDTTVWKYTENNGEVVLLPDIRKPALYTGNYGDCLGSSLIQLDRFDASFYKDNMTVIFHLGGKTNLTSEALMMYIGVYAYGESRFELTFNPCEANIPSLCPARSTVPIQADGNIPLAQSNIADIPNIAYSIPDFEGQVILRIFANSTQSEIGCYAGVVTNGASFSQPAAVGSILGIFTFVAMVSSFATAIYGDNIPAMRKHYAHSLSVGVIFAVWHHIFFTGALSMNWPSVLVAWWSNFAWAGGMIYTNSMQDSIAKLVGTHRGNTAQLGAAATGTDASSNVGGGYDIHTIYKRLTTSNLVRDMHSHNLEGVLGKRDLVNSSSGYKWYGSRVRDGLPLPGNFSGFAGTLAEENIPASNAFMTGFIWFLILLVIVAGSVVGFKVILDVLVKRKIVKTERLNYFRTHWRAYTAMALLRACFIGFFAMTFLTVFQFTYDAAPGPVAIAAVVFVIFFFGMFGIAAYALWYRLHHGIWTSEQNRVILKRRKALKIIPWLTFERGPTGTDTEGAPQKPKGGFSTWSISHNDPEAKPIQEDEDYIKKFGWLASRFRRTKWWFFGAWLPYEFIRALVYAGASGHSMVQVFMLLVIEFIAFIAIVKIRPFEGQRLNLIMVYLLGFSKVITVALSAAFDVSFNLARITTTAIGIVIIVIQGLLTIVVMIAIVLSAISSYMSVLRNKEDFRPRKWAPHREKYFAHLDRAVTDLPPPAPPEPVQPEEPKDPYFSVNSVKRVAKIEDEDPEFQADIAMDPRASQMSLGSLQSHHEPRSRVSRAVSVSSQMNYSSLPFGARVHRGSWSTRDFFEHQEAQERPFSPPGMKSSRASLVGEPVQPYVNAQSMEKFASTETFHSQRVYPIQKQALNNEGDTKSVSDVPSMSRPASEGNLIGAAASPNMFSRSSSPSANNALLVRPVTPQNTRATSPMQGASSRASPEATRMSPIPRSRSTLKKHRPRDSIDEEAVEMS